eukprot:9889196-Ditylum_brightwellii.AAC.1
MVMAEAMPVAQQAQAGKKLPREIEPQRLLQKLVQNFCTNTDLCRSFLTTFVALLNDDPGAAVQGVRMLEEEGVENNSGGSA